jgi:hypothetical protein
MKNEIFITVILLTACACTASAALDYASAQAYANDYNSRLNNAPDVLKGLLGSERVELNVILINGSLFQVGFETQDAKIVRVYPGGIPNPTIDINTTESAINIIRNSDDKIGAFKKEMDYGQVTITGNNLSTRVKLGVVLSSLSVLQFFGNIFFS